MQIAGRFLGTMLAGMILALAALGAAPSARADTAGDASLFITSLSDRAVAYLSGPGLTQQDREDNFRAMLNDHFDMQAISKFVLGRYWRTAGESERIEFRRLLEEFLVQSYAFRFADYSGIGFTVLDTRPGPQDDVAIVESSVAREGEDVRVDWRLRRRDDSFVIIDIVIEGVSMTVTQRSEFASVIQSRGGKVTGLLEALRAKIAQGNNQSAAQ